LDDYGSRHKEFFDQMSAWLNIDLIKFREGEGLEGVPQAFTGLLEEKNL
jgi:NADPH-dependent curcumin reductase CurA